MEEAPKEPDGVDNVPCELVLVRALEEKERSLSLPSCIGVGSETFLTNGAGFWGG